MECLVHIYCPLFYGVLYKPIRTFYEGQSPLSVIWVVIAFSILIFSSNSLPYGAFVTHMLIFFNVAKRSNIFFMTCRFCVSVKKIWWRRKLIVPWNCSVSLEQKKCLKDWETLADYGELRKPHLQSVAIVNVWRGGPGPFLCQFWAGIETVKKFKARVFFFFPTDVKHMYTNWIKCTSLKYTIQHILTYIISCVTTTQIKIV